MCGGDGRRGVCAGDEQALATHQVGGRAVPRTQTLGIPGGVHAVARTGDCTTTCLVEGLYRGPSYSSCKLTCDRCNPNKKITVISKTMHTVPRKQKHPLVAYLLQALPLVRRHTIDFL